MEDVRSSTDHSSRVSYLNSQQMAIQEDDRKMDESTDETSDTMHDEVELHGARHCCECKCVIQ